LLIKKSEITKLSADIRNIIDGKRIDIRDNKEGALSILKNDIYTLSERLTEQTESLAREKSQLKDALADISHQIKTPLTSIMVMADLLSDAPPEKQAQFIQNIRATIKHTDYLVSVLLKTAKLEAGAVTFNRENVDSGVLIDLAMSTLSILLEIKAQRITRNGAAQIFCDKRQTVEALSNIIKNASEFSPEKTEIIITAGENPICSFISVKDSGKGIEKTEIPKLFRRFSGSSNAEGYGIGLPLAYAVMKNQGGDIDVLSKPGEGTLFTLKFFK
jgi:signal transduction histidine kinase